MKNLSYALLIIVCLALPVSLAGFPCRGGRGFLRSRHAQDARKHDDRANRRRRRRFRPRHDSASPGRGGYGEHPAGARQGSGAAQAGGRNHRRAGKGNRVHAGVAGEEGKGIKWGVRDW
jgi:hypothetical protein